MDLKIDDVAHLLNVPLPTIEKWLAEGKIPSYTMNGQHRFSIEEIDAWVMQHGEETLLEGSPKGVHKYSLYRALHRGHVLDNLAGTTKEDIISQTTTRLAENFDLDPTVLADLLLDREQLMTTGLGKGIAVPHTRDFLLPTHFDVITIVYPKTPIPFDALDGEPVHTLFFLFACAHTRHLDLLAKLAHFANEPANQTILKGRPNKTALLAHVKSWEENLKG